MTAGELSAQFSVSKPTMSAHFAVLREARLVVSEKQGKSVVYQLQISVLEEALLGFAQVFGWDLKDSSEESGQAPDLAQDLAQDPSAKKETSNP